MQFIGQSHVVRVALENGTPSRDTLQRRFEAAYWDRFQVELDEIRARVVNLNCSVIGVSDPVDLSVLMNAAEASDTLEPVETRGVTFDGKVTQTPVYWRDNLPLNAVIEGPALVEQMDSTVLIDPGTTARRDGVGNLILEVRP